MIALMANETPGDVAAPLNRTKGPIVARDHYTLTPLRCPGPRHGNEISKRKGNLIVSFVLAKHHQACFFRSDSDY